MYSIIIFRNLARFLEGSNSDIDLDIKGSKVRCTLMVDDQASISLY